MSPRISAKTLWLAISASVFSSQVSFAQTAGGGVSGTIDQQLHRPAPPVSSPNIPLDVAPRGDGAAAAVDLRFFVERIEFEGNTVLPLDKLQAAVAPYTHREVTLAELKAAAGAVTALYSEAGYVLGFALIPEQDVRGGVVRMTVIEGSIGRVEVEIKGRGVAVSKARLENAIRRRLQGLVDSRPLRMADLERTVLGADDLEGLKVGVVLRPSKDQEGKSDLYAVVEAATADVELSSDNRLRREFGRETAGANLHGYSLLTAGDELEFEARVSRIVEGMRYWDLRYQLPLGLSGLTGFASYSIATTDAQAGLLEDLAFNGRESVGRIGARLPLQRSRNSNLFVQALFTAIDSRSEVFRTPLVKDQARTLQAEVLYDWASSSGAVSVASVGLIQGLDGLGATPEGNLLASRAFATPDFTALTAGFFRRQPLGPFLVTLDLDGQTVLQGSAVASMECAYGGSRFGRAYDAGVIGGDQCFRGSLEVAWPWVARPGALVTPFGFIDGAAIRQKGLLVVGEERGTSASSGGIGLRLALPYALTAEGLVGFPFDGDAAGAEDGAQLFFSLSLAL